MKGATGILTFSHLKKVGPSPYSVETSAKIMLPPTSDVKNVQKLLDWLDHLQLKSDITVESTG